MNAAERFLHSLLAEVENLGIGSDEAVNGADAVDLLNKIRSDTRAFLKLDSREPT